MGMGGTRLKRGPTYSLPHPDADDPLMRSVCFATVLCLFGIATPTFGQLSPEASLKSLTVPNGLEVSLWASEPLFVNPTTITIDHKGRVWVCEAVNYRR